MEQESRKAVKEGWNIAQESRKAVKKGWNVAQEGRNMTRESRRMEPGKPEQDRRGERE